MQQTRLRGLDGLLNLFDTLPRATAEALGEELDDIAYLVLDAQREEVPVRTGALQRDLSMLVLVGQLKARIGLLGTTGAYGKRFYGLIVEGGRRAQTVMVERRRRVNGRLRTSGRRKRASDIVARYKLNVPAMAARPFVHSARAEAAALDGAERVADFWSRTFDRVGGA